MAKETKKGLGKGLGALFGDSVSLDGLTKSTTVEKSEEKVEKSTKKAPSKKKADVVESVVPMGEQITELPCDSIQPNPWQPRQSFDEDALADLTESISEKGVISPLLVVDKEGTYILVAGERRLRAAKASGLEKVPVIIRALTSEDMAQIALIENIQRADLNAIEEARGYASLIAKYDYTQQELAKMIGKSRPHIANLLRLLDLPEVILDAVRQGKLSAGHARALLAIKDPELQAGLCSDAIAQEMSVRALEHLIQDILSFDDTPDSKKRKKEKPATEKWRNVSDQLTDQLQTKVRIKDNGKVGKLVIDFYGDEDLTRILDVLNIECY